MKSIVIISLTVFLAVLPACSPSFSMTEALPAQTETSVQVQFLTISKEELAEASYLTDFVAQGKVSLQNGRYEEQIAEGASGIVKFQLLDQFGIGDINADGSPDAAVILVAQPGGTGTFYELSVLLGEKGGLLPKAVKLLGDRVRIESITIQDGEIVIALVTHNPDDPLCCPTLHITQRYRLRGDLLEALP